MRTSSSPKSIKKTKLKPVNGNVLSIQLRPLKGKAAHLKEYRSMIAEQYGKEKKKKIYETMYSGVNNKWPTQITSGSTFLTPNIRLNLRMDNNPSEMRTTARRRDHVKL